MAAPFEVLSAPISDLTFQHVREFCAHQIPENVRLDYKAEISEKKPGKQIAKLIAAFGNTQGGTILFGVNEVEGSNRIPEQVP